MLSMITIYIFWKLTSIFNKIVRCFLFEINSIYDVICIIHVYLFERTTSNYLLLWMQNQFLLVLTFWEHFLYKKWPKNLNVTRWAISHQIFFFADSINIPPIMLMNYLGHQLDCCVFHFKIFVLKKWFVCFAQ